MKHASIIGVEVDKHLVGGDIGVTRDVMLQGAQIQTIEGTD
jgi:hypothetical protein